MLITFFKQYFSVLVIITLLLVALLPITLKAEDKTVKSLISTCSGCHGYNGNSDNKNIPNIAGLNQNYLVKQLVDFQSGKRKSKDMYAITQLIPSKVEMIELAQYFEKQEMIKTINKEDFSGNKFVNLKLGKLIYEGHRIEYGIPACGACHGKDGMGTKEGRYPRLKNQHREYIITQMQLFQSKERSNDNPSMMRNISMVMDREDIESVAAYISTLK